jgi:hypothetical protein
MTTTKETIAEALAYAEDLAVHAAPEQLLLGALDRECGPFVLADLLAHELVASHHLMQRIAAATHGILNSSAPIGDGAADGADEPSAQAADANPAADLAAARLAGVAGRLMEQVRLGLIALRRVRPDLPEDEEGIWLALRWEEERCSPEELERRVADAKAARDRLNPPAPKTPPLSPRAEAVRANAMAAAAELAEEAGVADLALAAVAEHRSKSFFARLFTIELGAVHDLTMRLAGCADRAFERAVTGAAEPALALQLSSVTARLGDRFRRGLLTLQHLAGGPGGPRKVTGLVWGGPEPSPSAIANAGSATAAA